MNNIIKNEFLTVEISELGAELQSIKDNEGNEYLWQGDEKYWDGKAPNIFPYVARLTEKKYTLFGNTYSMGTHGFARNSVFEAEQISDTEVIFTLCETPETLKQYPYNFCFKVGFKIEGNQLINTFYVKNNDEKVMYCGLGGHPGFNVPFEDNTEFEDYYLEFENKEVPLQVVFSDDCYVLGKQPYKLDGGNKLPLYHSLFDNDAIVLENAGQTVTLKSKNGKKAIKAYFPDMRYIGFWHRERSDAPYVCIEPWFSLPSRKGIIEDFEKQEGLLKLEKNKEYKTEISFEIIGI